MFRALCDQVVHTLKYGSKIVVIINIDGDKAIFLLFFGHQDTESE